MNRLAHRANSFQGSGLSATHAAIEAVYRDESRRVFATLVRLLGDFDAAEEALQEAFASALEQWSKSGIPENPRAWLISTGRFKAIDAGRRDGRFADRRTEIARRLEQIATINSDRANEEIEDDRLRLVFTCCHPAIDPTVQVPLTLREVCGLTTEEIARAFLATPTAMAQRIVRGKAKIRDAGIPFVIPAGEDLPDRIDSVLTVIYLVFNEGYSPTTGDSLTRGDLSGEAIRLGRLMVELLPDPEAIGLLALMLLQESRRAARSTPEGDVILLEEQDRTRWDKEMIREGLEMVERALATRRFGAYGVQAAIAATHARARNAGETDWGNIVDLYDALRAIHPSPVIELNRAVAIAMRDGPAAGLHLIDDLLNRGALSSYHLAHAARADLCRRVGRLKEARTAYEAALALARQEPERRFLRKRLATL